MNNDTKSTDKKVVDQIEGVSELHESELESVAGALPGDHCPTWKNTSKTWGF
jgi:hypothetical protein